MDKYFEQNNQGRQDPSYILDKKEAPKNYTIHQPTEDVHQQNKSRWRTVLQQTMQHRKTEIKNSTYI